MEKFAFCIGCSRQKFDFLFVSAAIAEKPMTSDEKGDSDSLTEHSGESPKAIPKRNANVTSPAIISNIVPPLTPAGVFGANNNAKSPVGCRGITEQLASLLPTSDDIFPDLLFLVWTGNSGAAFSPSGGKQTAKEEYFYCHSL